MLDYTRDAAEIYRQSFATIRAEADLSRFPDDVARVVVRLIHTCGQVDVAELGRKRRHLHPEGQGRQDRDRLR